MKKQNSIRSFLASIDLLRSAVHFVRYKTEGIKDRIKFYKIIRNALTKMQGLEYEYKGKRVVCMSKGWCVQADKNDTRELSKILRNKREISAIVFVERLLRQGNWVIDMGVRLGVFTHFVAYTVGITGKVIAIETDTKYTNLLEDTAKINGTEKRIQIQKKPIDIKTIDDLIPVYGYVKCCKIDIYKDIQTIFAGATRVIKEGNIENFLLRFRDTALDRNELIKNLRWIIDEMHYTLYLLGNGNRIGDLYRFGMIHAINPEDVTKKLDQGQEIDIVLEAGYKIISKTNRHL